MISSRLSTWRKLFYGTGETQVPLQRSPRGHDGAVLGYQPSRKNRTQPGRVDPVGSEGRAFLGERATGLVEGTPWSGDEHSVVDCGASKREESGG